MVDEDDAQCPRPQCGLPQGDDDAAGKYQYGELDGERRFPVAAGEKHRCSDGNEFCAALYNAALSYRSGAAVLVRKIILAVSVIALSACSTPPQKPAGLARGDYTYTREYITWLIEQEMRDADVTGLSIALVDDQQVVWAQGFGYAGQGGRHQGDAGYRVSPRFHRQGVHRDGGDATGRAGQAGYRPAAAEISARVLDQEPLRRHPRHHAAQHHDAPFRPARLLGARHERAPPGAVRGAGHGGARRICRHAAEHGVRLFQPRRVAARRGDRRGQRRLLCRLHEPLSVAAARHDAFGIRARAFPARPTRTARRSRRSRCATCRRAA